MKSSSTKQSASPRDDNSVLLEETPKTITEPLLNAKAPGAIQAIIKGSEGWGEEGSPLSHLLGCVFPLLCWVACVQIRE
jgi:hypothetical protein